MCKTGTVKYRRVLGFNLLELFEIFFWGKTFNLVPSFPPPAGRETSWQQGWERSSYFWWEVEGQSMDRNYGFCVLIEEYRLGTKHKSTVNFITGYEAVAKNIKNGLVI